MECSRERIIEILQAHLDSWHTENAVVLMPIDPKPDMPSLKDILSLLQNQDDSSQLPASKEWKCQTEIRHFDHHSTWEDVEDMTIDEAISILSRFANTDEKDWSARPPLAKACQIAIKALKEKTKDLAWCKSRIDIVPGE